MGVKILIIILVLFLVNITRSWLPWPGPAGGVLMNAVLVGLVMGDYKTGLELGGTYELMNIGLNPLGESVVPNYNLGSIVGTYFAITVDKDMGTAMGIVVATLATMLNTFSWYACFPFKNWMERALKQHQWKTVMVAEVLNWILPFMISTALPVALVMSIGESAANSFVNAVPAWLTHGFSVAGNALPAMGFAIVLRSLNVSKNIEYLIIGFVLYAFCGVGTVGASLVGLAFALMKFKEVKAQQALAASSAAGGVGDE